MIKFGRIGNNTLSSLYFPTARALAPLETSPRGTNEIEASLSTGLGGVIRLD